MSFEDFWSMYPKKVAKQDALKAWGQLTMFDLEEIDIALELHCRVFQRREYDRIPYPGTWLRGRRWEDDMAHEQQRLDHEFFKMNGYRRES